MPRLLLAFDFDYTMADHDSEHFVLEQLAPDLFEKVSPTQPASSPNHSHNRLLHISGWNAASIHRVTLIPHFVLNAWTFDARPTRPTDPLDPPTVQMRTLRDKHQWTDLMDMLLGDLHAKGVSPADIIQTLHRIPFVSRPKLWRFPFLIPTFISQPDPLTHFYISEITKAKNVNDYISHVITNTGKFDESGRLRLTRHTIDPPHNCSRCSPNLCKGKELVEYIARNGPFDRVIYLGDGRNDFCPSTKLSR
eukprot:jgi/Hompol1/6403/HPOL_000859-RA